MKSHFRSTIVYYFQHLVKEGHRDPSRVIVADLLETIELTKEQQDYVLRMTDEDKKIIDDVLILVRKMRKDKQLDMKALEVIEHSLKHIRSK